MSKIRNKISSIEADDDVVTRALGLHPVSDSEPLAPVAPPEDLKVPEKTKQDDNISKRDAKRTKAPSIDTETTPAIVRRPPQRYSEQVDAPKWPLWLSLALAAIWLVGTLLSVVFLFGTEKIASYSAGQMGGLAFFVLFPLLLIGVVYTALKNLTGLTFQAGRLENAADALMQVDETVVRRATEMSGVIKKEIDTLNSGVDTALTRVSTLQDVLETETERLGETSLAVEDKTQKITERLTTEREALWNISNAFEEQMKSLSQSLDSHSENLAMSTKTAEQKIQEARVSVENTASKINQTSDLIRSNTVEAATTLTTNQEEILKLSNLLKDRASELDNIYQKHGQDLNAMISQMRNEQEVLSQSLEERLSKMRDVALSAQVSAERLNEASEAGRQTVTSLSEAAQLSESAIKNRFSEMEEMVKFSNQRAESISEKAARRVQNSLSHTREEIARIETDMMNLQEKLSSASHAQAEFISQPVEDLELEAPTPSDFEPAPEPEVPAKKSKGALKFIPLEDDADSDIPVREEEDIDLSAKITSASGLVAGLRPAPEPQADIVPDNLDSDSELNVEPPELHVEAAAPSEPSFQRTIETPEGSKSWWKNLFGKSEPAPDLADLITSDSGDVITPPQASAAPIAAPDPAVPKATNRPITHSLLGALSSHGLSPNAIVDNGTIVQAVENRIQRGTKVMSTGVANRLGEPITILAGLLQNDVALHDQAIDFAVKFHNSLGPIADEPTGLMAKLSTEDGRLFLMCDAALNGLS